MPDQVASRTSPISRTAFGRRLNGFSKLAVTLALAGSMVSAAAAQTAAPTDDELLRDFIHYVRIDRAQLANDFGKGLLDRLAKPWGNAETEKGMKLDAFVKLLEGSGELSRFEEAAARAQRIGETEATASRLLRAYEQGKLERARDAGEISRNISMLTGTQRQRLLARERLAFASEYAVPQLLEALKKRSEIALNAEVRQLLVDMGRSTVMPLASTLGGLDPTMQEVVAGILGEISYPNSLPYLYQAFATSNVPAVKSAARAAITKIAGSFDQAAPVSAQFASLADRYSLREESLTVFPREDMQLAWTFDPASGLSATPVRTPVFHDMMAMRLAETALKADAANAQALAIWLGSNFSREINSPEGYDNPLYQPPRRDAMYYAVAAGPAAMQRVLERALDRQDTALVRRVIASIEKTAGTAAMAAAGEGGRRPLLEALRYPNRRVQYEAALALAAGQPQQSFDGAERVVPLLGSVIRDAGAKFAVVLADAAERRESLSAGLREQGYTVLASGSSLADAAVAEAVASAAGVDLIVTSLPAAATATAVSEVRGQSKLAATPVLARASAQGRMELGGTVGRDPLSRLVGDGLTAEQYAQAVKQLVDQAAGGVVSADDAAAYKARAVAALRDLAVAGNPVFSVADASSALLGSLASDTGGTRMAVADVLARIGEPRVQEALIAAAMNAKGDDMIGLLAKATDSAKRFGNLLPERTVKQLLAYVPAGDADATAVAALIGALNLQTDRIIPLVVGENK